MDIQSKPLFFGSQLLVYQDFPHYILDGLICKLWLFQQREYAPFFLNYVLKEV